MTNNAPTFNRLCTVQHDYLSTAHDSHERRTWSVVWVTAAMMLAEIIGGTLYGSMAVVADGWHMATHAAALTITALAFRYARAHAHDGRFAFGTGKVGELSGFASALVLAMISLLIAVESATRLVTPHSIDFAQAMGLAVLGLVVNLVSAALLQQHDDHHHGHHHEHDHEDEHGGHDNSHDHGHEHHDSNLRAAYLHVLADALTSVLAIVALLLARFQGWVWMDPLMGLVGAAVIAHWSWGLLRTSGAHLVDLNRDAALWQQVRARFTQSGDELRDLHLWRIGPGHFAVVAVVGTHSQSTPEDFRQRLRDLPTLTHVTVEVHRSQPSQG